MRLSNKTHYGIQMLAYMATRPTDWLSLSSISNELKLPFAFLKHIAAALKRKKVLQSLEGVRGGYRLAKGPDEITLSMIFNALGEKIELTPCVKANCNHERCLTGVFWQGVAGRLDQAFSSSTLSLVAKSLPERIKSK